MKEQNFLGTFKREEAQEIRILNIPIYRRGWIVKIYPSQDYCKVIGEAAFTLKSLGEKDHESTST